MSMHYIVIWWIGSGLSSDPGGDLGGRFRNQAIENTPIRPYPRIEKLQFDTLAGKTLVIVETMSARQIDVFVCIELAANFQNTVLASEAVGDLQRTRPHRVEGEPYFPT